MGLEEYVERLTQHRDRVSTQLEGIRSQAATLEDELQKIETALGALTGRSPGTKRPAKASVTTDDVVAAIRALVAETTLEKDELKRRVADQLKAQGKALTGFAIRFGHALKRPEFTVIDGKVARAPREEGAD